MMKAYTSFFLLFACEPSLAFSPQAPLRDVSRTALFSTPGMGERVMENLNLQPPMSPAAGGLAAPGMPSAPERVNQGPMNGNTSWDMATPVLIQGNSLRTWSFDQNVKRVQLLMRTGGRPMHSNVELWHGPDNTPQKIGLYVEDGNERPMNAVIELPKGPNSVAVFNTGNLEFPLSAGVQPGSEEPMDISVLKTARTVQGGALHTYPFDATVQSVQILLRTEGRPLNARIELLQGPNNNKQVMEVYTEDGYDRPFYVVIATPGSGNVIRLLNTAPLEFPLTASVEPLEVATTFDAMSDGRTFNDINIY